MEEKVISGGKIREAKAFGRYLHIAPTKVQDLLRLVRGKSVSEAENVLKFSGKKGGRTALKVLKSAQANAGAGFEKGNWVVKEARADKGPIYRRRVIPRARGSRDVARSASTHITIVLRQSDDRREEHGA